MTWIFGYGSLMWEPGFAYQERKSAQLSGYHREFCMVATRNRGTKEVPGMVLSLAPGGQVVGMAYRIERAQEPQALSYLDEREGVGRAHRRVVVPVGAWEARQPGAFFPTWTYLPILTSPSYRCTLSLQERARLVAMGRGIKGTSFDYLRLLLRELAQLGVSEPALEELFECTRSLMPEQAALSAD
ncbi:MAG TPA: gamma-glutamylcyclotransferase [bacterium]|nr:gamma-glutamylcyclotransferase [bacterium]